MRRLMSRQDGQALIIVLAFMFMSVPLMAGVLQLASTMALDSRTKTLILKSQYTSLGAQQYAIHSLLSDTSTLPIELNGTTVTTTVQKLDQPPGPLPFPPSADSNRRLFTFLSSTPAVTPASDTSTTYKITFTITLMNRDDKSTSRPTCMRSWRPVSALWAAPRL